MLYTGLVWSRSLLIRSLVAFALLLLTISPAIAEPLAGRVIDGQTLEPVEGVELRTSRGQTARSNAQGYFRFSDVPSGRLVLRARAPGYELAEERLRIPEGGVLDQSVILFSTEASGEIVEVRGRKRPPQAIAPGKQELSREEITRIPGTRGDALQSVRSLPGVGNSTARGSGPGIMVIRGAAPEDSKVMVDGIQVPLLYHFFGFQSILPSEFIDSIEYLPGGFGPQEGNATGGVINVKTRQIQSDEAEGFAELSFINLAGLVHGPISKKHKLHYAVAGRRSLIDYVLPAAIPEDVNLDFLAAPIYYDGQLRVDWRPKYSDRVSLFVMASSDEMALLNDEVTPNEPLLTGGIENITRFVRPILSWKHETESFESTLVGSVGIGGFQLDLGPDRYFDLSSVNSEFRSDQLWRPAEAITVRGGLSHIDRQADIDSKFPLPPNEGQGGIPNFSTAPVIETHAAFSNAVTGGYMGMDWHPLSKVTVSPGLRLDYYHRFNAASWGPRLAVQRAFTDAFTGRFIMGSYTRSAEQAEAYTTTLRPEEATQYVLGGEYDFARGIKLQSSVYYTDRRMLITQDPKLAEMDPQNSYINAGYGRSFGFETTLRAQRDKFFGWLTYTLSRSDRVDNPVGERRLFDYDQTHNLVALASYKLGAWQFGARFQGSTGRPLTPVVGNRYLSDLNIYVPVLGELNSQRYESDHQLDIRVDRKWNFEAWKLELYLDITNVYANAKILGYTYNFDYSERSAFTEVPFLPSIGLRGSF